MIYVKIKYISCFFILLLILSNCGQQQTNNNHKLIIFHAGSLSVPLKEVIELFNKEYPEISILTEAAGSRDCARKITDLKKECDVMASADYTVIDQLLIPDHASWNIHFASNEMVIVYHDEEQSFRKIDSTNWFNILLNDEIKYGRSEPNADPCGYRTVLVAKLAEKYYNIPGFASKLMAKDQQYIRPKETDLLALFETNTVDFIFIYRSIAEQHGLKYLTLPDAINLKSSKFTEEYSSVTVDLSGREPGSIITQIGEPMVYGITIPTNAPNKSTAIKFVDFLLSDKGMAIMEKNGQPSIVPSYSDSFQNIPVSLKKYALKK
ncbi:MAG: tungstate ABC transporter substrate-binding protein WtpA [Bacteroidetes bacterium]|nr:tungstate ABC transporter substrate-binding protein WtpA [Bacteroidota bacterium]